MNNFDNLFNKPVPGMTKDGEQSPILPELKKDNSKFSIKKRPMSKQSYIANVVDKFHNGFSSDEENPIAAHFTNAAAICRPPKVPAKAPDSSRNPFTEESAIQTVIHKAEEEIRQAEGHRSRSRRKQFKTHSQSEAMLNPILLEKPEEKEAETPLNGENEAQALKGSEDDYFNDRLLKFKLMKVKNIFAPTYEMDKDEGEKMRKEIKLKAQVEMDDLINREIKENEKLTRNKEERKGMTRVQKREGSSDSTSEGSNSFKAPGFKSTRARNRILRIKKGKNSRGLMNKLNIMRHNIHQRKQNQSKSDDSPATPENNVKSFISSLSSKKVKKFKIHPKKQVLGRRGKGGDPTSTPVIENKAKELLAARARTDSLDVEYLGDLLDELD